MQFANGHGVQVAALLPGIRAIAPGRDQVRLLQNAEVLHHAESRHVRKYFTKLGHGEAVGGEKAIEQRAPIGVGQGSKHFIH